jgi:hypothetical protein
VTGYQSNLLFTVTVVGGPYVLSLFCLRSLSPSPERLQVMDSSKSDAPPSYDANHAIFTSTLSYGSSIQRRPPSTRTVFSWARLGSRATVLSRIHNLVTSPNYTPSSVAPIVDSCAATLSVSQFSNLLQSLNVRGHTAMYWAILNDRREALSALVGYISQISSVCSDDLRTACMLVSNHILFTQLGLELEMGRECMPVLIPTK